MTPMTLARCDYRPGDPSDALRVATANGFTRDTTTGTERWVVGGVRAHPPLRVSVAFNRPRTNRSLAGAALTLTLTGDLTPAGIQLRPTTGLNACVAAAASPVLLDTELTAAILYDAHTAVAASTRGWNAHATGARPPYDRHAWQNRLLVISNVYTLTDPTARAAALGILRTDFAGTFEDLLLLLETALLPGSLRPADQTTSSP